MTDLIVIGCGNVLAGDDGVGAVAARLVSAAGVRAVVVEAGTPGLGLLDILARYRRAIIIDAVIVPGEPGRVFVVDPGDLDFDQPGAVHGFGVAHALGLGSALGLELPAITVIGIAIERPRTWPQGLSPVVMRAASRAAAMVAGMAGQE